MQIGMPQKANEEENIYAGLFDQVSSQWSAHRLYREGGGVLA